MAANVLATASETNIFGGIPDIIRKFATAISALGLTRFD